MSPPTITDTSLGVIEEMVERIVAHLAYIFPPGDWSDSSVEEAHSNRQALVSCALVNHAWHHASQKHLYHTISASYHEDYCKAICTTLEDHERLLDHVRVLRLSADWLANWWPLGWKAFSKIPYLEELEVHFEFYPTEERAEEIWRAISRSTGIRNVKRLIVHGYILPSIATFRSHMQLFPQIEHLEIHNFNIGTGESESLNAETSATGNYTTIKPTLQSFKWVLNYGASTHELDPMSILAWFNVSGLTELSLETTATDWAPILSLCTLAKGSLRDLHITYYDPGTDEKVVIANSALPNLLELATQLPNTTSTFVLHGTAPYLIPWMQTSSNEADLVLLDPRRVKLSVNASQEPPTELQDFAETLRTLRKHVNVEFTFDTYKKKPLLAAAPFLSKLLEEKIVAINVMQLSEPGSPEPGEDSDDEAVPGSGA